MKLRTVSIVAWLAVSAVAAGCMLPPVQIVSEPEPTMATRKVDAVALRGSVLAPANVIATGGGNVIATGGGNLIGQAGGNVMTSGDLDVIATGGGNMVQRRVLAGSGATIAGAKVYLADGHGNPLKGVSALKTDATGHFNFPRVPAGRGFMVVAEFTTKKGETARLTTLTRPAKGGSTADVDAASTFVTSALTRSEVGALGDFSTELFARARETARAEIKPDRLPDWRQAPAVQAAAEQLVTAVPALKADVEILRGEIRQAPRETVETLENDLESLNKNAPAAPAPSAAPAAPVDTPSQAPAAPTAPATPAATPPPPQPETHRLLDDFRTSTPGVARWRYRTVSGSGAWAGGTRFDVQHPSHPGSLTMWLAGLTGTPADNPDFTWRVTAFGSETLLVHPSARYDAAIDWVAPGAGTASFLYDVQAMPETANGVRLVVRQPGSGAVVDTVLTGASRVAAGERSVTVQAGQLWTMRIGSNGEATGDGVTVKAVVTFTPAQ